ncbi:alpha- and gamma-adaptin-binding protein p34-like [Planococcus citri]|uniref:alpha- and gamma-adaptin-binding protein p34-like n=1 Tax=Planococcus citri TaxID=170843 RepID=UPI0031F742FD
MTFLPSILVADIHGGKGEEIIKLITKTEEVGNSEVQSGSSCFKWQIDNKYYYADVNLCTSNPQTSFSEDFKDFVEAVILHFDADKRIVIDDLNKWLSYLESFHISEKILLCRTCKELTEVEKDAVNDWCIKNEYELVELESPQTEDDSDISFPEAVGIDRVIEILHSHQWPNLIRKEKIVHESDLSNDEILEESASKTQTCENSNHSKSRHEDESLADEDEFENMEQLTLIFKNLRSMKNEISSLTTEQKLDQAEKVVKAFWNAVGGDADEFSDSDDNENICS